MDTIDNLLEVLSVDHEVSLRPCGGRWEVIVISYADNSVYRHVDRSPTIALREALKMVAMNPEKVR
jgi:hypothetical protein